MTLATPCVAESSDTASLEFANGLYARRMYGAAIAEYEKFIQTNPHSGEVASARFRAADARYFSRNYKSAIHFFKEFLRDFPDDRRVPTAQFRLGLAYYHLKQFAPAMRVFSELSRHPRPRLKISRVNSSEDQLDSRFRGNDIRAGALFYRGKVYAAKNKPEKALRVFEALTRFYPESEYAGYAALAIGEEAALRGNTEEALAAYMEAMANPTLEIASEARIRIAEIYFVRKDYEQAADFYKMSLQKFPQTTAEKALLGLFACYFEQKDLKEALRLWQTHKAFIAQSSAEPQILMILAELQSERNKDSALRLFEKVLSHPKTSETLREKALFKKAFLLDVLGRGEEAASIYRSIKQRYPGGSYAKVIVEKEALEAIESQIETGEYDGAAKNAADFVRDYPSSHFIDGAHYKSGVAFTGLKKYAEAAGAFQKVSEDSTLRSQALYGIAASLENQGLSEKAIPYYEEMNRLYSEEPLSKEALSRLVYLYIQTENLEKAGLLYEEILTQRPTVKIDADAGLWLAQYRLDRGQYDALVALTKALPDRFPTVENTHAFSFFRGEAFLGLKNYSKAAEAYAEALRLSPDGNYAALAFLGKGLAALALNDTSAAEKDFNATLRFDDETKVTLRARFEIAAIRYRAGNFAEAAKGFMLVAILYDDPKFVPLSLKKAAECFKALGKEREAAEALEELKMRYPQYESSLRKRGST